MEGVGKITKKTAVEKAQTEYVQFAEQQRRLKEAEAEGEGDITCLLKWKTNPNK